LDLHGGIFTAGARGEGFIPYSGLFGSLPGTDVWFYYMVISSLGNRSGNSDPVPYAVGTLWSDLKLTQLAPDSESWFPFVCNGGMQQLSPPAGDFGRIECLTRQGYSLWLVEDAGSQPGRHPDPQSERWIAVTPAGTIDLAKARPDAINAHGDFAYHETTGDGAFKIFLAAPLAGMGPGFHLQSEIPGMPTNGMVLAFNSSGTFLVSDGTRNFPTHIITRGKASPLWEMLPSFVTGQAPYVMVDRLNEAGLMTAAPFSLRWPDGVRQYTGLYLLTPMIDCDLSPSVPPPYRLGQEFDLVVTVSNLASVAVANLVMGDGSGSPGLSQSPLTFDILSGPTPAGPLTLGPGATTTFTYHCKAKRAGGGIVSARISATSPDGDPLRGYAETVVKVVQYADLQIKLSSESVTNFALVGVYQRAPSGPQARKVELVADDDVAGFDVKVVNDEPTTLALRVISQETGSTSIPITYQVGASEITAAIRGDDGWTTPQLAQGGTVLVHVEFGPSQGAVNGEIRSALMAVVPDNSGATLDVVQAQVVKAPPIDVTIRHPGESGLTPQSIDAGKAYIDAPLVFNTDPVRLGSLTKVKRGLVADGITPLLFELTVPPEQFAGLSGGIDYTAALELVDGGTLAGASVDSRLRVLKNGQWATDHKLTFTAATNTLFACLTPIGSDDLQFSGPVKELKLHLHFTHTASGGDAGEKTFYLRKPPIALVHGYNTGGDWGDAFSGILGTSRPRFTANGEEDFIRTIRYGQGPPGARESARLNTVLPFDNLAPMLEQAFKVSMIPLTVDWAFTRFDVVAHSQGGVLTRILCTQNGNQMVLPYRNAENFNRGRFHRVVTIGSPHNGSRILLYMLDLGSRLDFSLWRPAIALPSIVSEFLICEGTAQDKFDPFGPHIRSINNPNSRAPWYPDPGARFHLVQATVNSGAPPDVVHFSPADVALHLDYTGGEVIPHGSDGVVDFDSMGAYTPEAGESAPANVFRVPASLQIAHAAVPLGVQITLGAQNCTTLFCGDAGQVESTDVARHVIAALDQSPSLPAAARVFGPFHLPAQLPLSISNRIQLAAQLVNPGAGTDIKPLNPSPGPRVVVTSAYQFAPDGITIVGPVTWSAERYGLGGITTNDITLTPAPSNPNGVVVTYDDALPGDVVLHAAGQDDTGHFILAAPKVIASIEPDTNNYALDSIEVRPSSAEYPVGTGIQPDFWATYASLTGGDPLVLQRWVDPKELAGNLSEWAGIMDLSNPLLWKFKAVGYTSVDVNWLGMSASADFTVYDPQLGGMDREGDGVADNIEEAVPGRNGQPDGDGNGDGIPDAYQFGVVSFRCPSGQWLTLDASTNHNLHFFDTHLISTPGDPDQLPQPYAFDQGFVTLSASGLTNGGTTVVRLFLPTNTQPDTVWAYGPEPGNSTPHWYEFLYDGVTGAEIQSTNVLLHLLDAGRGDADGLADGVISGFTFGLGRLISTPPALQIAGGDQGTVILSWPAVFPNADHTYLEATDDLGPTNQWQFVPDVPIQSGGQNLLIQSVGCGAKFYRLHSQ
jgi:hypothetical protein